MRFVLGWMSSGARRAARNGLTGLGCRHDSQRIRLFEMRIIRVRGVFKRRDLSVWADKVSVRSDPDAAVSRNPSDCRGRRAATAERLWPVFCPGSDRIASCLLAGSDVSPADFNGGTDRSVRRNCSGIPGDQVDPRRLSGQTNQRVIHGSPRDSERREDRGKVAGDLNARGDRVLEVCQEQCSRIGRFHPCVARQSGEDGVRLGKRVRRESHSPSRTCLRVTGWARYDSIRYGTAALVSNTTESAAAITGAGCRSIGRRCRR